MIRETRKLQKVGGSTFSVSLPKPWVAERELSPGAPVTVAAGTGDAVEIRPGAAEDDDRVAEVGADELDPQTLRRTVRAAYTAGIDRLTLAGDEPLATDQRRAISAATDELPGATISEAAGDAVVVAVLLDADQVALDQSVAQLATVACGAHRAAVSALVGAEEPPDNPREAARLQALVERHAQAGVERVAVQGALEVSRPRLLALALVARELGSVAEQAAEIGEIAAVLGADTVVAGGPEPQDTDAEAAEAVGLPGVLPDLAEDAVLAVERATDAVLDATVPPGDPPSGSAVQQRCRDLAATLRSETSVEGMAAEDAVAGRRAIRFCERTAGSAARIADLARREALRAAPETAAAGAVPAIQPSAEE